MATMQPGSHIAESTAGPQHYQAAGSGSPLLLVHGIGALASTWAPVAEAFSDHYRVIMPDLAGHGLSAPQAGVITFATELAGLEAVVREACAEPAILVGHSLGGWLACLLTLDHPEFVNRLVLVNGPLLLPWPQGLSLIPADRAAAARLFAATSAPGAAPASEAMLDAYITYAKAGPISRFVFDLEAWRPYFLNDRLQDFPRPVDLIWGMEDKLVTFANAEILLQKLPQVRITRLEGCGHVPYFDCPRRFIDALSAVLREPVPRAESYDCW